MTRISTLSQHNLTQSQIAATQQRMQDLQIQLSTGQKARRYTGISSDSNQLLNLESTKMRINQYLSSNNNLDLRLRTMEQSVAKTFDVASSLKTFLVNAINSENAAELPVQLTAQNMLDTVASALNVKLGDRYLFSGSATDTAPVDFNDPGFLPPPSAYPSNADTSYYQGDTTRLSARIADNFDVDWGVTADEPGFEQLIRALNLVATATTTPGNIDKLRLQEALTVVNQAIDNIPTIRSRIAAVQKSIDGANDLHNDLNLYMDENITNIKAVDIPMTVTKMTNEQLILESSFMSVSRLSQLTLTNFLK